MNLKETLCLVPRAVKVMVLRRRVPLIAAWRITDRCNYSCRYCGYWQEAQGAEELTTKEVFKVVDQLVLAGIRKLGFTGGEPLIRDDFGDILEYCSQHGISVGVNTNGSLLGKHLKHLHRLKKISLSLDGPREVNDSIRGRGAFDNVMQALEIARERNIERIELTAVLSKANVDCMEYLLDLAQGLKVRIIFQPATRIMVGSDKENPLAFSEAELKKMVSVLRRAKRSNRFLGNSLAGLEYLSRYPNFPTIRCVQGLIAARLDVDSTLYTCYRLFGAKKHKCSRVIDVGFEKAWAELKPLICSAGCDCSKAVELSLALAGNIDAILNGFSLY